MAALVAENAPLTGRMTPLGQVGSGTQNEPRDALLAHHLVCEPCRVQRLAVVLRSHHAEQPRQPCARVIAQRAADVDGTISPSLL